MANKRRTINITVSDNRVERNPRTARPMEDRNYVGKVRSRTCIDESWISSPKRTLALKHATDGNRSEIDKLLAHRYGQVRLVPSRISSFRNPYDLRYTTSCQSGSHRRASGGTTDPRFRRTVVVVDKPEKNEEPQLATTDINNNGEQQCLVPPCGPTSMKPQMTSNVSVAVQTLQLLPNDETVNSSPPDARTVTLKRSTSDMCLWKKHHHKGCDGQESSVSTPRTRSGEPSPRSFSCCEYFCTYEKGGNKVDVHESVASSEDLNLTIRDTTCTEPPKLDTSTSSQKNQSSASKCARHLSCSGNKKTIKAQHLKSSSVREARKLERVTNTDKAMEQKTNNSCSEQLHHEESRKRTESFKQNGALANSNNKSHPKVPSNNKVIREIAKEGYVYRAILSTAHTLLVGMILLSLVWFLFISIDTLHHWRNPPKPGLVNSLGRLIFNVLKRISVLEKCKCS